MKLTRLQAVWLLVAGVLLLDQALKFWIKLNMALGDQQNVLGRYLQFHFIENEGMAFGLMLPGEWGKLMLSLFRIIAVGLIGWWLTTLAKERAPKVILFGVALIFAGAMGNIIDSAFYGLIFSDSDTLHPAKLFPPEGGYAGFLHGRVVDMLRMEIFDFKLGGRSYHFFEPIFNIADASITSGVALFVAGSLFQMKKNPAAPTSPPVPETNDSSVPENPLPPSEEEAPNHPDDAPKAPENA